MSTPDVTACARTREALEIAAVEPHGLDILAEARTPEDATVVAHVAACAECAAEAARLREIAVLLRSGFAPSPTPDLRERTLAYVGAVGRPRASTAPRPVALPRGAPSRRVALVGLAMAAIVVVAVGATALVATGVVRSELAAERDRAAQLARKASTALRLLDDPAAIRIPMAGPGGFSGVAVISTSGYGGGITGAVVAPGLPEAAAGSEYVCYVVIDGQRRFVGRMAGDGTMHAWAGPLDAFADARPGSVGEYGVLLVPAGSGSVEGVPVMTGSLQG
jgi:hypothetical protein